MHISMPESNNSRDPSTSGSDLDFNMFDLLWYAKTVTGQQSAERLPT